MDHSVAKKVMSRKGVNGAVPKWVSIYFVPVPDKKAMKCNLCEMELYGDGKSVEFMEHMKDSHKDIFELHRDNPEATVGFRVEFLHLNVFKDDMNKSEPEVYLGDLCEPGQETEVHEEALPEGEDDVINMQYVMLDSKRKHTKSKKMPSEKSEHRKRSWIWKYFHKLSNIVYRCNICNVVLSIKGCNTNNLNRHMRSRHPENYRTEKFGEVQARQEELDVAELITSDADAPHAIITEEIYASNREPMIIQPDTPSMKLRRSWIWSYFDHVSSTSAQCRLCHRQINHGGNATGNMNRHLKMIHHKTSSENDWVWKVFERETNGYSCKICQHKLGKNDADTDVMAIMAHLEKEHGVVSGDQIITGSECLAEQ